jgi:hypothetical protein
VNAACAGARRRLASSPISATTLPGRIPRAEAIADALLGGTAPSDLRATSGGARARLERGLGSITPLDSRPLLARIGYYQVARALDALLAGSATTPAPEHDAFRWSSRAARRPVGLAAVRARLEGRAATPADAVALVMSDPGGPHGLGRVGPGSCADWVASLAAPARSMVSAEATSWATRLWTAIDWGRLDPEKLSVGGPDRWWRWSGAGTGRTARIALRGRADVRLRLDATVRGGPPHGAHLVVLDGHPGRATRHALMLSALVDALTSIRSSDQATVPSRVVGWWPDSGKVWIIPVDAHTLGVAADAAVVTAGVLLGSGASGGPGAPGGLGGSH